MDLFIASLVVFGVAIVAMSVGVLFRGKCLKGTCGGLNQMRDENGRPICEVCAPEKVNKLNGS